MTSDQISQAVAALRAGGVIAYPTEAVWGLGCDPHNERALARLLELKGRPAGKGLILVAASFDPLRPFLQSLDAEREAAVLATWPGPVTWLWPANTSVSPLLRGEHDTLAVRISDHPLVVALCAAFGGPVVSTSANRSGEPPARTREEVLARFGDALDFVLDGETGGRERPSEIRDARTGKVIRPG
ncbi:MAG TPA: threonylcarbamoyl-AMP synthase [Bryobacterales bacterium]|nr:threonylcarbamoyl-AMP synthase [Bryobacterales bacterium]